MQFHTYTLGKGGGRSPSCTMHPVDAHPFTSLLVWAWCQCRTQEKDRRVYSWLASARREGQKLMSHFVSSTAFRARRHLPPEPNGSLPWMVCCCYCFNFLVFYLFPLPLQSRSEVPLLPADQERLWEQIGIVD